MAARDPFDEAVQPEPAKVVGHGARRVVVQLSALELRDEIAQLPMTEAGGGEGEETEGVHQCVDPAVAEAEARSPLIVDANGGRDGVELVFADQAVVAQRFDV